MAITFRYEYFDFTDFNDYVKVLFQRAKNFTNRNVSRYLKALPNYLLYKYYQLNTFRRAYIILTSFKKIQKIQSKMIKHPEKHIIDLRFFFKHEIEAKKLLQQCLTSFQKYQDKQPRIPFSHKIYQVLIRLNEQVNTLSKIDLQEIVKKEMATMATPMKQTIVRRNLFFATIIIYIIMLTPIIYLMIVKTIPIISGIIGLILGSAFLIVMSSDFYPWEDKHC